MEIDKAKRLMELQACICHFLELYDQELEGLTDSEERREFKKSIARITELNFTEAMVPIIHKYRNLNPYIGDEGVSEWWEAALSEHVKVKSIRRLKKNR
jgi:hypothetical protein